MRHRRMRIGESILTVLLLAALALASRGVALSQAPAGAASEAVRPPEMKVQSHRQANGLVVLMHEDHSAPIVNLQVWYHVGSKDERPGRTGFAHLFEHLMFKGSANVAPDEHSRIIEAAGGFDNAYTTDDVTVYWQTFPSNYLERIIWLEADRLTSLKVDEANFKSEREVVKEERRSRIEDPPYGRVAEDLYDAAFTVHPYKHLTIGSMDDLNKATLDDVRSFFQTYYRPDNATMVIAGDFNPAQAVAWVEKYFSGIARPSAPIPRVTVEEPPQTAERRLTKAYSNTPLPAVVAAYRMPAQYHPDAYPLELASNILSQGESSRLYRKLVYEDRIALQSAGFGVFSEHPNLFWAFAVMNQGNTLEEGERALDAVLEEMKTKPVDARELEKAKNQIISSFVLGRRTVQQKASAIGQVAVLGKDVSLVNTELERYQRVTPADIQRVAGKYLVKEQRTMMLVEPPRAGGEQ